MPSPSERNLSNFKISESFWRLMQTDPIDDRTLIDGTGSIVAYLAVSGTLDAFYFKGDGSQLINIPSSAFTLNSGIVSGSLQTIAHLFNTNIISGSGQLNILGLSPSDSPIFSGLRINGDIIASQYIVSSSVYYVTESYYSGSSRHGDSQDDRHEFTGSLRVTGSIYGSYFIGDGSQLTNIVALGTISSSKQISDMGFITASRWEDIIGKPAGIVSGSAQTLNHLLNTNIVSGSGQRNILGLAESDSPTFSTLYATHANFAGNLVVGGTITARSYVVSSSVVNIQMIYVSGSSTFGDTIDDTHRFTGSIYITGSFTVPSISSTSSIALIGSLGIYENRLFIYV